MKAGIHPRGCCGVLTGAAEPDEAVVSLAIEKALTGEARAGFRGELTAGEQQADSVPQKDVAAGNCKQLQMRAKETQYLRHGLKLGKLKFKGKSYRRV